MDQARQREISRENHREAHRSAGQDWSIFIGALAVIAVIFGFMYYGDSAGVNNENALAPSAGQESPAPAYDGATMTENPANTSTVAPSTADRQLP